MDRPFMPKYGTVSQVLLQLVVAYNLLLSLLEESVKSVRLVVWLYFFLRYIHWHWSPDYKLQSRTKVVRTHPPNAAFFLLLTRVLVHPMLFNSS